MDDVRRKTAVITRGVGLALARVLARDPQIKAAILFPGLHVVNTRLLSAASNLQPDYDDPVLAAAGQALQNVNFKQAMESVTGHAIEMTEPEEFAEEVLQSILRGDFYILPLNDHFRQGFEDRCRAMLERLEPVALDVQ